MIEKDYVSVLSILFSRGPWREVSASHQLRHRECCVALCTLPSGLASLSLPTTYVSTSSLSPTRSSLPCYIPSSSPFPHTSGASLLGGAFQPPTSPPALRSGATQGRSIKVSAALWPASDKNKLQAQRKSKRTLFSSSLSCRHSQQTQE
ncbi:hypothetical protein E2C01_030260 [Portunus trituberculatus]|uniref:Uncharacterized protein n=1 Tax=Portunus trituberculatus TaxID=210409 RepID=A0A5B7EQE9_PORTR|nr:hypothetical protein [Portunus trituberculatus]